MAVQLYTCHLEKGLTQFTEAITKQRTWTYLRQLKAMHKGIEREGIDQICLRSLNKEGTTKGQLSLLKRWQEAGRFLWKKLANNSKFVDVPEGKVFDSWNNKFKQPKVVDEVILKPIAAKGVPGQLIAGDLGQFQDDLKKLATSLPTEGIPDSARKKTEEIIQVLNDPQAEEQLLDHLGQLIGEHRLLEKNPDSLKALLDQFGLKAQQAHPDIYDPAQHHVVGEFFSSDIANYNTAHIALEDSTVITNMGGDAVRKAPVRRTRVFQKGEHPLTDVQYQTLKDRFEFFDPYTLHDIQLSPVEDVLQFVVDPNTLNAEKLGTAYILPEHNPGQADKYQKAFAGFRSLIDFAADPEGYRALEGIAQKLDTNADALISAYPKPAEQWETTAKAVKAVLDNPALLDKEELIPGAVHEHSTYREVTRQFINTYMKLFGDQHLHLEMRDSLLPTL